MRHRICALLILLLAGCAASAQTRPASVNVAALLPQHPLYGALAQYDRQIAVLQSTLHTQFSDADAQIANSSRAIQRDLSTASAFVSREQSRTSASSFSDSHVMLSLSKHDPAANIEQHMRTNYAAQHAALQGTAQRDMASFRAALLAQQQQAFATFVQSVDGRTQRAHAARAQELREKESALLLELAQRDAQQRLTLRAKLQTLAMTGERRAKLKSQLRALQAREDASVSALRRVDATVLAQYDRRLHAKADSDIAKMQSTLQARTAATLAARERVLAAQTSNAAGLQLPSASRSGGAAQMQQQYQALLRAPGPDTSTFDAARSDLTQRFASLRSDNDADTASVRSQIASLEHDKSALRKKMIAQIMAQAQAVAKARGYSSVYAASNAPAGSADITPAVRSAIAALVP